MKDAKYFADALLSYFSQRLYEFGYDPESERVFIPVAVARDWFIAYMHAGGAIWDSDLQSGAGGLARMASTTKAVRWIMEAAEVDGFARLTRYAGRSHGRGLQWCKADGRLRFDLAARIDARHAPMWSI